MSANKRKYGIYHILTPIGYLLLLLLVIRTARGLVDVGENVKVTDALGAGFALIQTRPRLIA